MMQTIGVNVEKPVDKGQVTTLMIPKDKSPGVHEVGIITSAVAVLLVLLCSPELTASCTAGNTSTDRVRRSWSILK